ncbi:MAG: hypothetical protein DRQ88_01010 [Epsilonproteobacteria bacterium]|nr:MAG: hypothetical protein DRQ89_05075 [Campylobacterota bacterium]RLA67873.1 MAG: hypothetical protein DRQ88_01010 [Campylobacterota bacterium]
MKNLGKMKNLWVMAILFVLCLPAFAGRAPANYFPSDDFEVAPIEHKSWVQFISAEDDKGILNEMRNTFRNWEQNEEMARLYNLRGVVVSPKEKTKYLGKYFLKYLDRRISQEAKKSDAGSGVKKLYSAKKTLNPKLHIGFSKDLRIRFKARPLKGYGSMIFQNPWIDFKLQAEITGKAYLEGFKDFYDFDMNSRVNYDIQSSTVLAEINKEIIDGMVANISYENQLKEKENQLQLQIKFARTF